MIVTYILDSDHNIIECEDPGEWGEWMENIDNRIVKKTKIGNSEVSTVFLGLDHNFNYSNQPHFPILFETTVFGPLDPCNDYRERYFSYNEARLGHEETVKQFQKLYENNKSFSYE